MYVAVSVSVRCMLPCMFFEAHVAVYVFVVYDVVYLFVVVYVAMHVTLCEFAEYLVVYVFDVVCVAFLCRSGACCHVWFVVVYMVMYVHVVMYIPESVRFVFVDIEVYVSFGECGCV